MQDTTVRLKCTINQGATFRKRIVRRYLPFDVQQDDCGALQRECSCDPILPSDYVNEDYTGCSARMQARETVDSPTVLFELSSANGGILLSGATLEIVVSNTASATLTKQSFIGQVDVTRTNGDVQRQFEIEFKLQKGSNL